jgi:hypothetical protein
VEDDGATVILTKYLCPAGADAHSSARLSLKSRCTKLGGVEFALAVSGEQSRTRLTSQLGMATWDGVPSGEFGLAERSTSGYGSPVVYCAVNDEPYGRVLSAGNGIRYETSDSETVRCDWFNIPLPTTGDGTPGAETGGTDTGTGGQQTEEPPADQGTGPATLTITKYHCPPGYDLYTEASDPENDCDEPALGASFTLESWPADSETDPQTETLDESTPAAVSFDDVEAGEYLVTEIPAEDVQIAWAFVLSCESSLGTSESSRFYPLALTGDNLSLRLTLYAGEELNCSWYNVPLGENTITVTLYECPGRVANPARCDVATEPATVYFYPVDAAAEEVALETSADGTGTTQLATGVYEVDTDSGQVCLIDSETVDDDGNIVVAEGDELVADIYVCSD